MLAFSWEHIGVMLGSFCHHAGTNEFHPKCCGADFDSRINISGNLLGQNDQNFDIYPFDWSQVASWGLAAEGEALTIYGCLSEASTFQIKIISEFYLPATASEGGF